MIPTEHDLIRLPESHLQDGIVGKRMVECVVARQHYSRHQSPNLPETSWPYIPWTDRKLVARIAHSLSKFYYTRCLSGDIPRFLEIGCGCGAVSGAFRVGWRLGSRKLVVHGIEIQKNLADLSVRNGWVDKIVAKDALEFKKYGEYDFLFIYQPILDADLSIQLTKQIIQGMKIGAFIIGDALSGQEQIRRHLAPTSFNSVYCKTREFELKF